MVAMRTAAGLLACWCLIVILLTADLPASPPVPPAPNSGSPCLQLQMTMEIGHYGGTKRRLLNYDDNGLRGMRRLDDTTGTTSSFPTLQLRISPSVRYLSSLRFVCKAPHTYIEF
jgi:hypothetical protein